ncbi:MAG: xanthan lyase, partial [Bacteroides sp.]|nr:xanthan lyase [Bacteroides sp.]
PNNEGLKVPIELSVSVHSDAGHSKIDNLIGTLGICTTNHNDGLLATGTHRLASRDLSDMIISQIQEDINYTYKADWPIRGIWDKSYSESRRPEVPSTIIELLSHQNFADLKYGHNPRFKFVVGRAIYKSILKYMAQKNNTEYVVQPLPVNSFSAEFGEKENTVILNWKSTVDKQEVSAISNRYVLYTSTDGVSFDNGTVVNSTSHTVKILPGKIYSFKVTALNDGGESFPSEVLSVHKSMTEKSVVMIVNGFDKISAPKIIDTMDEAGFDVVNGTDISYMKNITTCGNQICFDRSLGGGEGIGSLGYSSDDMIDVISAGNTFNYPYKHGQSIVMARDYSFVSCSKEAVEKNLVDLNKYEIVNYILGLQGQSAGGVSTDKTFSNKMQAVIDEYCRLGGNLLVSGAYIASDMSKNDEDRFFISNVLKYQLDEEAKKHDEGLYGLTLQFGLFSERNPKTYRVPSIDAITPSKGAIAVLGFNDNGQACGVAYKGKYKVFALSFPFESIVTKHERDVLMASILNYFTKK